MSTPKWARILEFTYKVGEGLLANSFEVVEDRFRIVSVGGLPHHWSHNVAKQFGHVSKMDIVLEVQDRLIEIDGWVAQVLICKINKKIIVSDRIINKKDHDSTKMI